MLFKGQISFIEFLSIISFSRLFRFDNGDISEILLFMRLRGLRFVRLLINAKSEILELFRVNSSSLFRVEIFSVFSISLKFPDNISNNVKFLQYSTPERSCSVINLISEIVSNSVLYISL